jgi:hypothetical protein
MLINLVHLGLVTSLNLGARTLSLTTLCTNLNYLIVKSGFQNIALAQRELICCPKYFNYENF